MGKLILICLLLVSQNGIADSIERIRVFHNNVYPVQFDLRLSEKIVVNVHNMDSKKQSVLELNQLVKDRVRTNMALKNSQDEFSRAFSHLQNGDEWPKIYAKLEEGGVAVEKAVRYKIKKIPAIVFNDNSVVYGVTSMSQAISLFHGRGRVR